MKEARVRLQIIAFNNLQTLFQDLNGLFGAGVPRGDTPL